MTSCLGCNGSSSVLFSLIQLDQGTQIQNSQPESCRTWSFAIWICLKLLVRSWNIHQKLKMGNQTQCTGFVLPSTAMPDLRPSTTGTIIIHPPTSTPTYTLCSWRSWHRGFIHIGWGDREIDRAPIDTEEDQGRADVEVDHDAFISCNHSPRKVTRVLWGNATSQRGRKNIRQPFPKKQYFFEVSKKGKNHPKGECGLSRGTLAWLKAKI